MSDSPEGYDVLNVLVSSCCHADHGAVMDGLASCRKCGTIGPVVPVNVTADPHLPTLSPSAATTVAPISGMEEERILYEQSRARRERNEWAKAVAAGWGWGTDSLHLGDDDVIFAIADVLYVESLRRRAPVTEG